ncbi:MAG: hypothetical protein GYA52_11635 [Chloroflexi bacterium]|nr:hypothetical protein [Chloroflexota bacterium]
MDTTISFNTAQQELLDSPIPGHIALNGPFKSGKTTVAIARMLQISAHCNPFGRLLVLVPQLSLAEKYRQAVLEAQFPAGNPPTITTLAGLSRQFIQLYWPLIQGRAGFNTHSSRPTFLNMETAQYFMGQVCQPFLDKKYFLEIRIDRARLFSQILDTMNKAALVGYALEETAPRLKAAWTGENIREKHYEQSQECALAFRAFCLQNNVLDYSLQVELFRRFILQDVSLQKDFFNTYTFLIADNLEEDVPVLHDLILDLDDNIPSMLLISDQHAGYRSFLGADATSAARLATICQQHVTFNEQFDIAEDIKAFNTSLMRCILKKETRQLPPVARAAYTLQNVPFYPDMVDAVCQTIQKLVTEQHQSPGQIAVLSPYLPDSLKFALAQKLSVAGIPFISSRPSRTLADEPITRTMLVFAKAAHPHWKLPIQVEELRLAIMTVFPQCDILRAALLAENSLTDGNRLDPFTDIPAFTRDRISHQIGNQYDELVQWIETYRLKQEILPLDIFLSQLFGEKLAQPGFGLHEDVDKATVLNNLIRSIHDFRTTFAALAEAQQVDVNQMYIQTLQNGLLPSRHALWNEQTDAVLISPAFTFLMKNRSVKYQFWLDIGSMGWWERLDQPLTHPYVLNRNWSVERRWTDAEEYQANQASLARLVEGLLERCESHVYLYAVGLNQACINQSSPLLSAMQLFLKRLRGAAQHA